MSTADITFTCTCMCAPPTARSKGISHHSCCTMYGGGGGNKTLSSINADLLLTIHVVVLWSLTLF